MLGVPYNNFVKDIFMTEKATKLGLTFEEFVSNRENYKYIFVAHFQKQTN